VYSGYIYYDTGTCFVNMRYIKNTCTRTHLVNMRVLKIPVLVTRRYSFTIFISYLLRVLFADTRRYWFFWHPYWWLH